MNAYCYFHFLQDLITVDGDKGFMLLLNALIVSIGCLPMLWYF